MYVHVFVLSYTMSFVRACKCVLHVWSVSWDVHSEPSDSGLSEIRTQYNNLSTKDMTYSPSIIPTIHFEPHKEENLSTKDMTYGSSIIPTIQCHFEPPKEETSVQRTNQLNLCRPQSVLYLEGPLCFDILQPDRF